PLTSLRMATLQKNTAVKGGAGIKLLTFSVDPAHDTPEVLAAYADRYRANAQRWRFITGDVDAVRTLVEGSFMQTMEDRGLTPSGAPDIVHGQHFLLVDGDLRIRGMYDSRDPKRLDALEYA